MQEDKKSRVNKNDFEDDANSVNMPKHYDYLDEELYDVSNSLKHQVEEALIDRDQEKAVQDKKNAMDGKSKLWKKILKIAGIIFAVILILAVLLIGTKGGRKMIYKIAGSYIYHSVDKEDNNVIVEYDPPLTDDDTNTDDDTTVPGDENTDASQETVVLRQEDYVTNYLIFGVEEIEHAKNTDSMIVVSINTKDDTIKLTSLLRDTLLDLPDHSPEKLNSVYARRGASGLVNAIEQSYRIKIDGYGSINFSSFERIINLLGGITITLGETEANYLNHTNYISNPAYRDVHAGVNVLNGNQALGYCRVRRVATLGGQTDDYGRTLRQRRVLEAIFNKYKSQNFVNLFSVTSKVLEEVTTDVSQSQIELALEDIVENQITTMETTRIPVNNTFKTPGSYLGVNDPVVIDWEENIKELYQFVFLDTEDDAQEAYEQSLQ